MRLLLVEDNPALAESTKLFLERNNYVVDHAESLRVAMQALKTHQFDLVLLDRMLPDGDGLQLMAMCRRIDIPMRFIVMTAMESIQAKIQGFETGVLDYVVKPVEPAELLARIKVALQYPLKSQTQNRSYGPLSFDKANRSFSINGANMILTRAEGLLLEALFLRCGATLAKDNLANCLYGYDKYINPNSLETQVSRLRRLLASHTQELHIVTVRGVGYCLKLTSANIE